MSTNKLHSKYFRISVTDRCNLSCYFCHNEGQFNSVNSSYLNAEDIIWSAGVAVNLGFTKFKITGGEPTLRNDLPQIISGIKGKGAKDISLITNGIKLLELSEELKNAGLDRINVSIYSLDVSSFKQNCNGNKRLLDAIVEGIDMAIKVGFENIKLNFIFNNSNRVDDLNNMIEFSRSRNIKLSILPLLNYNLKTSDQIYSFDELYESVKLIGIDSEKVITDSEGFRQRFILTSSGAKILLKIDHLADKRPFIACSNCQHSNDCLEGIFPFRLSSHGILLTCLAKGMSELNVRAAIENRNESEFKTLINKIA